MAEMVNRTVNSACLFSSANIVPRSLVLSAENGACDRARYSCWQLWMCALCWLLLAHYMTSYAEMLDLLILSRFVIFYYIVNIVFFFLGLSLYHEQGWNFTAGLCLAWDLQPSPSLWYVRNGTVLWDVT